MYRCLFGYFPFKGDNLGSQKEKVIGLEYDLP